MALSVGEWAAIIGIGLTASGFNIGNAIRAWIKSRDTLNERFTTFRNECKQETDKLEILARAKFGKHSRAISNLLTQISRLTEKVNDNSELLYQIKHYLEPQGFADKGGPEKLKNIDPFSSSFDLEITEIPEIGEPE